MIQTFEEVTRLEISIRMDLSLCAFQEYKTKSAENKAIFLECIADEIELLGDALIDLAATETNLPAARLIGPNNRTITNVCKYAS